MKKWFKYGLLISVTSFFIIIILIIYGLYLMEIEDFYGENQDFYFKSTKGDIVINRDSVEFGEIYKTWTRVYAVSNSDTIDLYEWLEKNKIEIYKQPSDNLEVTNLNFNQIESLIEKGQLKLIMKNK